jgi:UDP-glucose 4-epimerase
MKVCVIGGAGYIGSHAVYELIKEGHDVVVIDNLSTGKKEMVHKKASFFYGDTTNKKSLEEIFSKYSFDVVMHFAAKLIVPESINMPLEYYYNNVEGVRILLEVMNDFNVKNIVFSSTAAVYGEPKEEIVDENSYTLPINPYGDSKLASEKLINWASLANNMNYCIFRYFNVAGAHESLEIGLDKEELTHLIPVVVSTLIGKRERMFIFGDDYKTKDGTCIRDYVHVSDIASAHVLGAKYIIENNKSLLANLGSNNGYSVKEIIDATSKYGSINFEIKPRREGDPAILIASNKLAKEILGWSLKYGLEDIIKTDLEYRKKLL